MLIFSRGAKGRKTSTAAKVAFASTFDRILACCKMGTMDTNCRNEFGYGHNSLIALNEVVLKNLEPLKNRESILVASKTLKDGCFWSYDNGVYYRSDLKSIPWFLRDDVSDRALLYLFSVDGVQTTDVAQAAFIFCLQPGLGDASENILNFHVTPYIRDFYHFFVELEYQGFPLIISESAKAKIPYDYVWPGDATAPRSDIERAYAQDLLENIRRVWDFMRNCLWQLENKGVIEFKNTEGKMQPVSPLDLPFFYATLGLFSYYDWDLLKIANQAQLDLGKHFDPEMVFDGIIINKGVETRLLSEMDYKAVISTCPSMLKLLDRIYSSMELKLPFDYPVAIQIQTYLRNEPASVNIASECGSTVILRNSADNFRAVRVMPIKEGIPGGRSFLDSIINLVSSGKSSAVKGGLPGDVLDTLATTNTSQTIGIYSPLAEQGNDPVLIAITEAHKTGVLYKQVNMQINHSSLAMSMRMVSGFSRDEKFLFHFLDRLNKCWFTLGRKCWTMKSNTKALLGIRESGETLYLSGDFGTVIGAKAYPIPKDVCSLGEISGPDDPILVVTANSSFEEVVPLKSESDFGTSWEYEEVPASIAEELGKGMVIGRLNQ